MEDKFVITNPKYNEGILIDEYNGNISLVLAQEGNDGKIYKRWAFPQVYDKAEKDNKPGAKALPIKLPLGEDTQDAINTLLTLAVKLGWDGSDNNKPIEDIPF